MTRPGCKLSRSLLLRLELKSNPRLLSVVRAAVKSLTEVSGFSAHGCRSVTRAVDEALSNIMRHSYGGLLGEPITLYFRRIQRRFDAGTDCGLEVQLWDHGVKFDPTSAPVRQLKELRPGGLGLHFIRQAVDTIEYRRVGRTNRLRLIKYLADHKSQPDC
jgi:serine/threonine-protein kinase RsbW